MATSKKINPKNYLPILDIPENQSGTLRIRHQVFKAGEGVMLNTFRALMFRGCSLPMRVTFDRDVRFHWLEDDKEGAWTSDLPIEQWQQFQDVKGLKGHVLVGGLGLGMIAKHLAKKKTVKAVTVVENSKDVVALVAPHIKDPKISVVCEDLFEYLKRAKAILNQGGGSLQPFTCAFYDIWRSDGEGTFFKVVCPLFQLSEGVVRGEVRNWNEGVMRGQLRHSITNRLLTIRNQEVFPARLPTDPKLWEEIKPEMYGKDYDTIFWNWTVPFFKWWKEYNPDDETTNQAADYYTQLYGRPKWEKRWEFIAESLLVGRASQ